MTNHDGKAALFLLLSFGVVLLAGCGGAPRVSYRKINVMMTARSKGAASGRSLVSYHWTNIGMTTCT